MTAPAATAVKRSQVVPAPGFARIAGQSEKGRRMPVARPARAPGSLVRLGRVGVAKFVEKNIRWRLPGSGIARLARKVRSRKSTENKRCNIMQRIKTATTPHAMPSGAGCAKTACALCAARSANATAHAGRPVGLIALRHSIGIGSVAPKESAGNNIVQKSTPIFVQYFFKKHLTIPLISGII